MKMLTALKFWIEDKIRMDEPHVAGHFTLQVMTKYVSLYTAFVANKVENAEFVNGPQLDTDDWVNFETGTYECLTSLQGGGGVKLLYMLRDELLRPAITINAPRDLKNFWNVPFLGPDFDADNARVWAYLAGRVFDTARWAHIKRYQIQTDGRSAWLTLCLFYGGRAENTRKIVVARAALEQLTWSNESTFKFNDYATQLINHFDTLEPGGQAKRPVLIPCIVTPGNAE